jgi:hypothetical protein
VNSLEALLALSAVVAIATRAIMALQPSDQEIAERHPGLIQLHELGHNASHTAAPSLILAAAKRGGSAKPDSVLDVLAVTGTATATAVALH